MRTDFLQADAYIFDIDGTLINSPDGVHYNAFRAALRQIYGIESDLFEVPVHGNTDLGILRAVVAKHGRANDFEVKLPRALEFIVTEVRRNASQIRPVLCPAIKELLQLLRSQGKLMGIASGNLEEVGWAKLEAAGIRDYFSFGSFSHAAQELRVDIFRHAVKSAQALWNGSRRSGNNSSPAAVFIVGDTPADVAAARAVGAPVIAVATGIYNVGNLQECKPDLCLDCCERFFD